MPFVRYVASPHVELISKKHWDNGEPASIIKRGLRASDRVEEAQHTRTLGVQVLPLWQNKVASPLSSNELSSMWAPEGAVYAQLPPYARFFGHSS